MADTKYKKFLHGPPVDPKYTSKWKNTSPDEKLGLTRQYFKDKRTWRKKFGSVPKHDFSGLSDSEVVSSLARSTHHSRGKGNLKKEFKQRSIDNPTMYEQLQREEQKRAKRDKSEDLVLKQAKAHGGYVKKYANGGSVRKVRR
tara:strand:+ start:67 stop:495 length:429 start_codon:yes stop_codon:yes gene_type:complete